jgi:hypothetical protein
MRLIFPIALVLGLAPCTLQSQGAAVLTSRFDSLFAVAQQAAGAQQWARVEPIGRMMARIARELDDPQREVTGMMFAASGDIGIDTDASRRSAGFAVDTAVSALERARRRAATPEARLAVLEQQSYVLDYWVHGISGRVTDFASVEAAFFATLAAADRGRARNLLDVVGGEIAAPFTPDELVSIGKRLHGLARSTNASVVSYLITDSRVMIWYSGPDRSLNLASTAIADTTFTAMVFAARAALGVDDAASPGARAIAESLDDARGVRIRAGVQRGDTAAVRALSELLLPPRILSAIGAAGRRDVLIVPHRAVAMVPFAALPAPSGAPLGSVFAFRYAPSLAVLEAVEARSTQSVFDSASTGLVVGDPTMPIIHERGRAISLAPLPGARREAEWLASQVGLTAVSGDAATESVVREAMPRMTLLHLATHGYAFADPLREGESFVALAPDATHDGLLRVAELEAMAGQLNADLVVLSACQTGLGSTRLSEGTIGLPRAFLAAGARSVLASLWSVSDEATELLMQRFYYWWLDGRGERTKAQALWRAQTDVRNDPRFSHPRYWAAFQLVGGN